MNKKQINMIISMMLFLLAAGLLMSGLSNIPNKISGERSIENVIYMISAIITAFAASKFWKKSTKI